MFNNARLLTPADKLQYVENFRPSLLSGDYTLVVEQKISTKTDAIPQPETYREEKTFTVKGERFNISPEEFSTLFPPPDSTGHFCNVLPHVVFSRRTLPWERNPGKPVDSTSWLALLLFTEDEDIQYKVGTVDDLVTINNDSNSKIFFPPIKLEYGESTSDSCAYIDISPLLLKKILPSSQDMLYLSHGRSSQSEDNIIDEYSVTVCNRFPSKGVKNTVHLVSLEGYGQYLDSIDQLSHYDSIRFISLKNWNFTPIDEQSSFAGILQNLDNTPSSLQIQPSQNNIKQVSNALNMGYVPMNHVTRQGLTTASWYRGPLVPYSVPNNVALPVMNPDQVTYYNPESGLFDISHSTAWQIGRLLALQNKSFSIALYLWKRQNWSKLLDNLSLRRIHKLMGFTKAQRLAANNKINQKTQEALFLRNKLSILLTRTGGDSDENSKKL